MKYGVACDKISLYKKDIITWGEPMITEKDIKRIAVLSKLEVCEKDVPLYIKEIEDMLLFAEGVESSLKESKGEIGALDYNMLRSDEVMPSSLSGDILSNAKDTEDNFFLLRKQA